MSDPRPVELTLPPALRPGDAIAVVAPASAAASEALAHGLSGLESAGYRVKPIGLDAPAHRYLAASDDARVEALNAAFRDPECRLVLAARGGYGLSRIVHRLDYEALRADPKLVAGYSDLTALHAAVGRQAGLVSYHSPHAVDGLGPGGECGVTAAAFWRVVTGEAPEPILTAPGHSDSVVLGEWAEGVAEGRLVGGNAAVLAGVIGTPYEPDFRGAILLLEDIGEAVYRLDRVLSQLRLAGKIDQIAGVALGYFTDISSRGGGLPAGGQLAEMLQEYLEPTGKPVLTGLPIGHSRPNHTVALGARYRLDSAAGELTPLGQLVAR